MKPDADGERMARETVIEAMRSQRLPNYTDLATAAEINPDTASDFLNGKRWPQRATLAKIETALSLPPGLLDAMRRGDTDFMQRHAARPSRVAGAKTLDEASDVELLMALLARATERLSGDHEN